MVAKVTPPNAAIFNSDPLEQICAKGTTDRDMSGLNNMFMVASGLQRQAGQDAYMAGLSRANAMALREAQMEAEQKMMEKLLQSGTELAKAGYETSSMPIMSRLFTDPRSQDVVADIWRKVQLAKAAADNAQAANVGGDNVQISTDVFPTGEGVSTVKTKGRTLDTAAANNQLVVQRLKEGAKGPKVDTATATQRLNQRSYGAQ